jgi:hypothetical protein
LPSGVHLTILAFPNLTVSLLFWSGDFKGEPVSSIWDKLLFPFLEAFFSGDLTLFLGFKFKSGFGTGIGTCWSSVPCPRSRTLKGLEAVWQTKSLPGSGLSKSTFLLLTWRRAKYFLDQNVIIKKSEKVNYKSTAYKYNKFKKAIDQNNQTKATGNQPSKYQIMFTLNSKGITYEQAQRNMSLFRQPNFGAGFNIGVIVYG